MVGKKKRDPRAATALDAEIGSRVRGRRIEIGMSQTELAGRIGVTFQQIQKYEKGANRVAATTLVQIAEALSVTVATLLPTTKDGNITLAMDTPGFKELSAVFAQLNNEGRCLLVSTARTFAANTGLKRSSRDRD